MRWEWMPWRGWRCIRGRWKRRGLVLVVVPDDRVIPLAGLDIHAFTAVDVDLAELAVGGFV